jgi:hypothetical protein
MSGVTLASLLKLCESHTLEHPVLSLSERFGCHFLQLSVVPAVNYHRLLSLTRLLQASGPFSLRIAGETAASQLVSETTLYSLFVTPHRMTGLEFPLDSSPSAGVLPNDYSYSSRFASSSPETYQFIRSWLTALSGLAQPHSSFVIVS